MRKRKQIFAFESVRPEPLDLFDCALCANKEVYDRYNLMSAAAQKELRERTKGMSYPEMRAFLAGKQAPASSGDHVSAVDADHLPGDKGGFL